MTQRKLQEIEKTLKKVSEGVELVESIFDKLQQASQQTQKEKLEAELKKEIKKLQKFRDQIKTWAASNDIKDKKPLLENRKLIETMERFKATEKELKTKAYSQAGLNRSLMVDPEEKEKEDIRNWITEMTDKLETQIDALEAEQESLRLGGRKSKKNDQKERSAKINAAIERHKHHQKQLEIILRMLDNGDLKPDQINSIQEDVVYYVDNNQEPEFEEDEGIYDDLNLEEAEVYGFKDDSETEEDLERESSEKRLSKQEDPKRKKSDKEEKKPVEKKASIPKPVPVPTTPKAAPPTPTPAPQTPRPSAPAPVEPAPLPQRYAAAAASVKPSTPKSVTSEPPLVPFAKVASPQAPPKTESPTHQMSPPPVREENGEALDNRFSPSLVDLVASFELTKERSQKQDDDYLSAMLETSFFNIPDAQDAARSKVYFPKNPYPVPGYYPQTPLSIFESSALIFERFDIDTLFFIFYFRQGTLQQYLAARELKRQSWRFHKKFLTWFQRHEEPRVITEEYEEGTYVYFDYEEAWCQRKKADFRFEYRFLEDDI